MTLGGASVFASRGVAGTSGSRERSPHPLNRDNYGAVEISRPSASADSKQASKTFCVFSAPENLLKELAGFSVGLQPSSLFTAQAMILVLRWFFCHHRFLQHRRDIGFCWFFFNHGFYTITSGYCFYSGFWAIIAFYGISPEFWILCFPGIRLLSFSGLLDKNLRLFIIKFLIQICDSQ